MKEYFSIGELVELFGLNMQTLYYCDSVGIFSPREHNEKNGRRKHGSDQIYELTTVSYMRRLGYSLEEIKESRTSLNSSRAMSIMKQYSQKPRRQWQRLLNIGGAVQRRIRFVKQEVDGVHLDEIAIRRFGDRRFISIDDEELLYGENFFYFYPTITFYEGDRKYFGAYLYPDHEKIPKAIPQSRIQIIRRDDFLYGYHLGRYKGVPGTIWRLREAKPDLELGTQAINFNVLDQFVESDNKNPITAMQTRALQIRMTDDAVSNEEIQKI